MNLFLFSDTAAATADAWRTAAFLRSACHLAAQRSNYHMSLHFILNQQKLVYGE
jgi:hypothetical protein